jgi:DNA-binding XRE family transcriptional regulator
MPYMMLKTNIQLGKMSDPAIVQEIGKGVRAIRLSGNMTQEQLAAKAGLDRTTIVQLEKGRAATLLTLVQILRVLQRLDVLNGFREEAGFSPLEMAKLMEKTRKRASAAGKTPGKKKRK